MPAAVADLSRLHVVVPVRALHGGKLRLADVLDERQRTALVTGLLRHTVAVLSTWPEATAVPVVRPDAPGLPGAPPRAEAGPGPTAPPPPPPDAIQPGFGPGSLERHLRAAAAIEASTQLVVEPALGFDLDTPDDLALLGQTRVDELFALAGAPAPASSAAP